MDFEFLFTISYWLYTLLYLVPAVVGIAVMGWQHTVLVKHEQSGLQKNGYVGYSLTYYFFGPIVPIIRGEIGIGVLHFVLTVISLGAFQFLVMPFLYNKQYMTRLLTNGWQLNGDDETNAYAKRKLGIAN